MLLGRAYSAESLAHGMFPGLVVAALLGVPLALGGAVGLVLAAAAIAAAARLRTLGADNAVAVVITTMLGVGTLLALSADSPPGLQNLLFGDVLATSPGSLALAGGLAAVALIGSWLAYPYLLDVRVRPGRGAFARRALTWGGGRARRAAHARRCSSACRRSATCSWSRR